MTVPNTTAKSGPYHGDGVVTVFNYDFIIVDETHLNVTVANVETGEEITLVLHSDYVVNDVGSTTGTITKSTPLAVGFDLTIIRSVPFVQETDLQNQGAYYAEVVERAFDLAAMRDQQMQEQLDRTPMIPPGALPGFPSWKIDFRGLELSNIGDATADNSAPTLRQVREMVPINGNVPSPGWGQVGARLRSTTDRQFGWFGGQPSNQVRVILGFGQSNSAGARTGGPNPANPLVKVWDKVAHAWGSSDITKAPWTYANPNGNTGNNNIGLSAAHRFADEYGVPTFLIYYFVGGTSIDHWVIDGNAGGNGDYYLAFKAAIAEAFATPELAGKKVTVDLGIFSQGEEDYTMDFATYLGKLTILKNQLNAETWFGPDTPLHITGMSGLHDRYQIEKVHRYFAAYLDAKVRWINSKGMKTDYDASGGVGDYTHFQGASLWDMGYRRIWSEFQSEKVAYKAEPPLFWGRGVGAAKPSDPQVIASFGSLVSWESRDLTSQAINSLVAGTGTFAWGYQCSPDGNYTQCFGYLTSTTNLCNYTGVFGRENTADDNGDYSLVSGFQNTASAFYTGVFGRGNIAADAGQLVCGQFAEFITAQVDPVVFQVGVGTTTGARGNGLTVRYTSGSVKAGKTWTVAGLPSAANAGDGALLNVSNLGGGSGMVRSDGTVWRRLKEEGIANNATASGAVTLTPLTSAPDTTFSGSLTGDLPVTLSTVGAYNGARFRVIRTGQSNAFYFTVQGRLVKQNEWLEYKYDGTNWVLSATGTLDATGNVRINAQTGTAYTLNLHDAGRMVTMNNAAANAITVPPNSSVPFGIGDSIDVASLGAGQTSVAAGAGVTIRSTNGRLKLAGQYTVGTIRKIGADEWLLAGDLTA